MGKSAAGAVYKGNAVEKLFFEFGWAAGGSPSGLGMKSCLSRMDIPCPEFREKNMKNSPHTNDSLDEKSADGAIWSNFGTLFF